MGIIKRLLMLSIIFPLVAYSQEVDIDWVNEIQARYDFSNLSGNQAFCYELKSVDQFPFITEQNNVELILAVKQNLVTEKIILGKNNDNKNRIIYHYNLTTLGQQHLTTFPRLKSTAFCYGKIIVDGISQVMQNPINEKIMSYTIIYQYKIEKIPTWITQQPYQYLAIDGKDDDHLSIAYFNIEDKQTTSNYTNYRFILPFK